MRLITKILIIVAVFLVAISAALVFANNPSDTRDVSSPSDTVQNNQIKVTDEGILVTLPGAILVAYNDTNSMDPVMDAGANGIEIPVTEDTILEVGDIVSYNASWNKTLVSHRIIEIGEDNKGTYYLLKGDNNTVGDPGKVRLEDIKYKLIMIIY